MKTTQLQHQNMIFTVVYTPETDKGYTVEVLELPGCISYGDTLDEADEMIKDAISLYIDSLQEEEKTSLFRHYTRPRFIRSLSYHYETV